MGTITGGAKGRATVRLAELQKEWLKSYGAKVRDYVPALSEQSTYNKLVQAVMNASATHETRAAFHQRIKDLGKAATNLAKTIGILA